MKTKLLLFTLSLSLTLASRAQYNIMHYFNDTLGSYSTGTLIMTGDTLYGVAGGGGKYTWGVIFSMKTNYTGYTDLHDFNDTLGATPNGALVRLGDTLYGTTGQGGTYNAGVIFSLRTNGGGFSVLHNFNDTLGKFPGTVIIKGDTIFGMTSQGGAYNYGVIYSMLTNGTGYTVLHNFNDTLGQHPGGALLLSGDTLYGTTGGGGLHNDGVLFSIQTNGSQFTDLYDFYFPSGDGPNGGLIRSGNTLYGMTNGGDINGICGVIYSIQTNGTGYTVVYGFNGTQGETPAGTIVLSGNTLYGMTGYGGIGYANNYTGFGVLFSVQTNGSAYTVLYQFGGWRYDGDRPMGSLLMKDSALYGTTLYGGYGPSLGYGIIFNYIVPPPLSVKSTDGYSGTMRLFPNPSAGNITLEYKVNDDNTNFVIYDMLGKELYKTTLPPTQNSLNVSTGLDDGIYLYSVINAESKTLKTGKVVVVK